jgi:L-gulonolactone oxidase
VRPAHQIATPAFRDQLSGLMCARDRRPLLPVGLGRSYGDTCLNADGRLIDMTRLDRFIAFDGDTGVVRAEAGLSLDELLRVTVPKGWFVATTPGTRFVTLGGAVANDVHGKNHQAAGSFGSCVRRFELVRSDGEVHDVPASSDSPFFCATVGGLGLTGLIASVEIALAPIRSAYLDVERLPFGNLSEFYALSADSLGKFEHTVAWIDCSSSGQKLGRGIFQRATWCDDGELRAHDNALMLSVPVEAPAFLLNGATLRTFNALYYHLRHFTRSRQRVHYARFFYPLDKVRHWNRLYGGRGFYQYQCVVPPASQEAVVAELLREISRSGKGSFLAVLKLLGPVPSKGMLSFAREGTTLALDFPNSGQANLDLLGRLDALLIAAGGRLYPAKDGRMPAGVFRASYPQWADFAQHVDPLIRSDFWRRVAA